MFYKFQCSLLCLLQKCTGKGALLRIYFFNSPTNKQILTLHQLALRKVYHEHHIVNSVQKKTLVNHFPVGRNQGKLFNL